MGDSDGVLGFEGREHEIFVKHIGRLTDGADDIGEDGLFVMLFLCEEEGMFAMVEGGAYEVIHGGVDNEDIAVLLSFVAYDACDKDGGIADNRASGFEDERSLICFEDVMDTLGIGLEMAFGIVMGGAYIESAAEVEAWHGDSVLL